MKWCWILSKAFSASVEMIKWFLSLWFIMFVVFVDFVFLVEVVHIHKRIFLIKTFYYKNSACLT
jgi:hypothetical protein